MAASVAGVGQFFSKKNVISSDSLLGFVKARKSPSFRPPFAMVRCSADQLSICLRSRQMMNKRGSRVSAAVAEDEAAASSVEESPVKEEREDEDVKTPPVNTKLYFGNLPYNCDSSQLAGIIHEYASPEMIEVSGSNQIKLFMINYNLN